MFSVGFGVASVYFAIQRLTLMKTLSYCLISVSFLSHSNNENEMLHSQKLRLEEQCRKKGEQDRDAW